MIKKIIFIVILLILPIIVFASDNTSFFVDGKSYDKLEDAINNAGSEDVIEMFSSAKFDEPITINKKVNIDLNGNDIISTSTAFFVQNGILNITGRGTIKEEKPNYGAIRVVGDNKENDSLYSVVNISKDVTLEGWAGIFITHENNNSHGVSVNFDGTIKAISDISNDKGIGIYVNGNIKHEESIPEINIGDNAKIYSNGTGLYLAGNTITNIGASYIEGKESGIGIKSGTLNINGATILCNGEDSTPTDGYNNGIKASGTTIQIESNNGYKGNIVINIVGGNLISKNSNVIYEYIGKGDITQVHNINISGGVFKSEANKDVFLLSDSFKNTHTNFISGGKYSSDPKDYLKNGYISDKENDMYEVSKSAMAVFSEKIDNNKNFSNYLIVIISLILIGFLFVNRNKIIKVIKKLT